MDLRWTADHLLLTRLVRKRVAEVREGASAAAVAVVEEDTAAAAAGVAVVMGVIEAVAAEIDTELPHYTLSIKRAGIDHNRCLLFLYSLCRLTRFEFVSF
jgi:hypothetical protein